MFFSSEDREWNGSCPFGLENEEPLHLSFGSEDEESTYVRSSEPKHEEQLLHLRSPNPRSEDCVEDRH